VGGHQTPNVAILDAVPATLKPGDKTEVKYVPSGTTSTTTPGTWCCERAWWSALAHSGRRYR
jgi:hypothetical protein